MKKIAWFLRWSAPVLFSLQAFALELDWSGQFWSEYQYIHQYSMDGSEGALLPDPTRAGQGGYYVAPGGGRDATFQTLFLRLRPKVIVNDNIYLKSEWWIGDPVVGVFGNGVPYSSDQRQYYSSQARGSSITAQRFWAEFITDLGTVQVGRVPLDWGLGVMWNQGDALWSRYISSQDAVRWIAKFGAFSFIPSFIVSSTGNTVGGACTFSSGVCNPTLGSGGITDYSLIIKYENSEDQLEGGINVVKRLGGSAQDPSAGLLTPPQSTAAGVANYLTYNFYAKKQFAHLSLAAEVPVVSGSLAGMSYNSFAFAGEADWKANDAFELLLKVGHASGQTNMLGNGMDSFRAFYFNPNYHIAMILFNYQLANLAGPQTLNSSQATASQLKSPYDNPIVDAQYLSLSGQIHASDKWTFRPSIIYARAPQTAQAGQYFYNYWTKSVAPQAAVKDQSSNLGWEFDLSIGFQWDDAFTFHLDQGLFLPGGFYAFSNTQTDNATSMVYAASFRVGVNF